MLQACVRLLLAVHPASHGFLDFSMKGMLPLYVCAEAFLHRRLCWV